VCQSAASPQEFERDQSLANITNTLTSAYLRGQTLTTVTNALREIRREFRDYEVERSLRITGGPDEVLASRTVRDLSAGSGLRFQSLGAHRLKGIPDETEVFRVTTRTGVPI
jgi:hypothetical protein